MIFLNTHQFAVLLNISDRMAGKALARCFDGQLYRGQQLIVQRVRGRGGNSGWQYRVRVDSLPAKLQEAWRANPVAVRGDDPAILDIDEFDDVASWRYEVIKGALKHPSRTPERARAIKAIAADYQSKPDGTRTRISERTVRDWLKAYEESGFGGISTKRRADRGARRTLVSRRWDKLGLPEESARAIAADIEAYTRSLWANLQPNSGWREVQRHASTELLRLTRPVAPDLPARKLRKLCMVPRTLVEHFREYGVVAVHDKDAKAYFDRYLPRVSRSIANLQPMQIVMGDVHPIDIYYRRPDRSEATPKGIFWMDVATRRLWCLPAFFPKGRGVRKEHVAESFVRMARDPVGGCPGSLYLDNGGEYNSLRLVADAMKLFIPVYWVEDGTFTPLSRDPITKAQPYNGPAKGDLEGAFGLLEKKYFSKIPGWIGGDRTRKKTANVGKPPAPFPHSRADLARAIHQAVALYNDTPQGGQLGGLSPNQKLRQFVEAGWGPTPFKPGVVEGAFCEVFSREVRAGKFQHKGVVYYNDALTNPAIGRRVEIRVPLFGDRERVMVFDRRREFVCVAFPEAAFDHGDRAGAVEASRRRKVARDHERAMKAQTQRIDTLELLEKEAAAIEPLPVPEPSGVIGFDPETEKAGRELAKSPHRLRDERSDAEKRRLAEWDSNVEKIKRVIGGNR